jgi:hypothetical protein
MRQELDEALCAKYPKIFKDRHASMMETLMCWGFDVGDGWYQALDSLCANIQHHIDWSHKNHEWDLKWNAEHPDEQRPVRDPVSQVVAVQVKEKFGGLRFYYDGGDDQVYGMVRMAESWAAHTCEQCGAPGKMRGHGWYYTACDLHTREEDLVDEEERRQEMKENGLEE